MIKQRFFPIIVSIIISIFALSPLIAPFLKSGRAWTYDVDYHAYRMAAFHQAVVEGQIPPRWSSQLVYGWGSPVFTFNWSLPYWMGEPFLFAGWSITDASKAVVIGTVLLSYIFIFLFLCEWFGWWPALVGSVVYEWSLFRIYLLFTGGGLGMHAAFIFWPVLFWAVRLVKKKQIASFVLFSVGTALLMLSHQVMFLLIQPLLWLFIGLTLPRNGARNTWLLGVAFLVGLGLSAYFWVPAFFEQRFIHIAITATLFKRNFLAIVTIMHQPGITDRIFLPLLYWYWSTGWNLFAIIAVSMMTLMADRKRRILWLFVGFFGVGQFFMTRASSVFWEHIPLLANFIYPVRFQALSLFSGSILAAYLTYRSKKRSAWLMGLVIIVATVGINALAIPTTWPRDSVSDSYYHRGDSTVDMMGEYEPVWTNIDHFFRDSERFERHPIARIVEGSGSIDAMIKRQADAQFTVRADSAVSVVINQLYFPGWQVRINGAITKPQVYGNGEMLIHVPKGTAQVTARFTDTPIRTLGNSISVATLVGMLSWLVYILWIKPRLMI